MPYGEQAIDGDAVGTSTLSFWTWDASQDFGNAIDCNEP